MEQEKDGLFFTVDEMLHVENGQEIDEMLSISLDPDISLQQYESYIQIRGLIILQGEYRRRAQSDTLANVRRDQAILMEKITEKSEQESAFMHRFPVDISIPEDRVDNLEDVRVLVEVFDYTLPDAYSMHIQATIHIQGVEAEQSLKKEATKIEESTHQDERDQEEVVEAPSEDIVSVEEDSHVLEHEEAFSPEVLASDDKEKKVDIQASNIEEEEEAKDVPFLIDLFSDTKEETKTTMKLYFIQEEDTIETVAKKYEVSALQLIKANELTDGTLTEGQCLHIPREDN